MKRTALMIGRFQPPHNGHLWLLEKLFSEFDRVIIGVGSAQEERTFENPFSADERKRMLDITLKEYSGRYEVVFIPDRNNYARWVPHVLSLTLPFDVVCTNNPLVRRLFENGGFKVKSFPLHDRKVLSGDEVRRRLRAKEPLVLLVQKDILKFIKRAQYL